MTEFYRDMASVDQAFAESDAVEAEYETASEAEEQSFMAVCSYRCRDAEEARTKAKYLLTTATVKDGWDDDAKAVLKSLIGEDGTA